MQMSRIVKIVICFLVSLVPLLASAQCAMCRTQVVNNVSHGETALAAGLNFGIIYLFAAPYVIVGLVAFLWFRNAKANEKKKRHSGSTAG